MNEERKAPPAVRPFFIQANGDNGHYVSSENVAYIYARKGDKGEALTGLYVVSGTEKYTNEAVVHVPVETVKDVFAEHGYDFVGQDDLMRRAQSKAPAP